MSAITLPNKRFYPVRVQILSVGGTFEKVYEPGVGVRNFSFGNVSAVRDILLKAGIAFSSVDYDCVTARDSLDMKDQDRMKVAEWCTNGSPYPRVVIHGTDTMNLTAAFVSSAKPQQAVVFTGAGKPARMTDTDADFNLGAAYAVAQILPPGVYIAMNGGVFNWYECEKNAGGRFDYKAKLKVGVLEPAA